MRERDRTQQRQLDVLQQKCLHKHQKGVVLVLALFFLAIVGGLSYWMMAKAARETRSVSLMLSDMHANLYAQGAIIWTQTQLKENLAKQKPNMPVDNIPIKSAIDKKRAYRIFSMITDMQAKFNLNNLTSNDAQMRFKKMCQVLLPNHQEQEIENIILAIVDWITPNAQDHTYQAYYFQRSPPYRAAHRPMVSVSELRLVKGMTPEIYDSLLPYVTALPNAAPINILTAEPPVIASLSESMTLETASVVYKLIRDKKIASVDEFLALDIMKNHTVTKKEQLTAISQYFLSEVHVESENQQLVIYTLLDRPKMKQAMPKIIWQSRQVPG